jgi:hypothetical protein
LDEGADSQFWLSSQPFIIKVTERTQIVERKRCVERRLTRLLLLSSGKATCLACVNISSSANPISATKLGSVESLIGTPVQIRRAVCFKAGSNARRTGVTEIRRVGERAGKPDRRQHPFYEFDCILLCCSRHNQYELLASDPPETVGTAHILMKPVRKIPQNEISGIMTMLIVDQFEIIDIEYGKASDDAIPGASQHIVYSRHDETAIGDPRQLVGLGSLDGLVAILPDAPATGAQRCYIARNAQHPTILLHGLGHPKPATIGQICLEGSIAYLSAA